MCEMFAECGGGLESMTGTGACKNDRWCARERTDRKMVVRGRRVIARRARHERPCGARYERRHEIRNAVCVRLRCAGIIRIGHFTAVVQSGLEARSEIG